MISELKELKKYLDSKVDVTDNPHDNIFLYKTHMWREHKIRSKDKEFFDKKYVKEYIENMRRIGWKSPKDRVKFIKAVEDGDTENKKSKSKKSNFEKFWGDPQYRVYTLQQMILYYSGAHTASKTAEILHVAIQDVWELAHKLDELYPREA